MRSPSFPPVIRSFTGPQLLQIAMPMGGIGAGCVCLNGHGGLQDFSLRHRPAFTALPDGHGNSESAFATLRVKRANQPAMTRLVEGPFPVEKIYDQGLQAQGYRHGGFEGMPRFQMSAFHAGYPFGRVEISDPNIPVKINVIGWNPFIPLDDHNSSLPCAILEYVLENTSNETVEAQFGYHLSHLATLRAPRGSTRIPDAMARKFGESGLLYTNSADHGDEKSGSIALAVVGQRARVKSTWLRGGWFDAISSLWRELETGNFVENDGPEIVSKREPAGGSVLVDVTLAPKAGVVVPILICWHFPNCNESHGAGAPAAPAGAALPVAGCCDPATGCPTPDPLWKPYYAAHFPDAGAVASHVMRNYESLRGRTLAFAEALAGSTLPAEALDAVSANLAILKSPTVLRQSNGNIWAWEGCFTTAGCCPGSCTHVWNYAQAMPHLFPALERTLREQELIRSIDERGHVNFRSALPDGPTGHGWHAAADGQLGGICKLYRDWQISGDTEWMTALYPQARRSLDYCIHTWDPDEKGGLFEPHHNTYDIEFWGPDGMCGSIYVAALAAMAAMARAVGDSADAERYDTLSKRAGRFMDEELFNGEYYHQKVTWENAHDQSFVRSLADPATPADLVALLKAEGPRYQYGNGCLSDGIIGGWFAAEYGIDIPLDANHVRSTLRAIFRHNFKPDLFDHACLQRPGYALGHEPGLLLCTWPNNDKPTLPFVYSDEVWTGIEYQVASHLIREGMVEQGLTIVRAVRSRYEGHVRNPFNEYECGSYYARAMASYAVLTALGGIRHRAVDRTLRVDPRIAQRPFRCFFCTASGFGTLELTDDAIAITLIEGSLTLDRVLVGPGQGALIPVPHPITPAHPWKAPLPA